MLHTQFEELHGNPPNIHICFNELACIRPRLPVRYSFICLQTKTLCSTLQESGTEGECPPYYTDCNEKCTPAPNATHSSSSFMLFSVAIYIYNFHHVDVSINCMHQQFHVTLVDSNCQFMSSAKHVMAISFVHCLSSLCKMVT